MNDQDIQDAIARQISKDAIRPALYLAIWYGVNIDPKSLDPFDSARLQAVRARMDSDYPGDDSDLVHDTMMRIAQHSDADDIAILARECFQAGLVHVLSGLQRILRHSPLEGGARVDIKTLVERTQAILNISKYDPFFK